MGDAEREETDIRHMQIELTSRCNMTCRTCVRGHFFTMWRGRDLSAAAVSHILDQDTACSSVHLQGWGESLLRPDCVQVIATFKQAGKQVSLSSNGSIMSTPLARDLIAAGLDSMAFSLAGASRRSHDALRGRGSFERCLESIRIFNRERRAAGTPLAVNYLLTPENMQDLPRMIRLSAGLGVDHLVCTNMVHICSEEQLRMAIYQSIEKYRLKVFLGNLTALLCSVNLSLPPLKKIELPVCDKNPVRNLFIGADGSVSPCVYLCPPISGELTRYYGAEKHLQTRTVFGNLNSETLQEIWQKEEYKTFRRMLRKRCEFHDRKVQPVSPDFEGMEKLMRIRNAVSAMLATNPPPEPCRICPKLYGM